MKVVLKLDLDGDKQKQKAIEAVSTLHGIDSIAVDMGVQEMTVIGSVDPADVLKKLRNSFPATDIVSVGPAKEQKKMDVIKIQTLHGSPPHQPLPRGSGDHPRLVTAELPSPRKTVELPDPDAEVIALSPKTLMATNRFVCEICNKGFQREQNLQLHRRGHKLPWKLRQRSGKEVRKRVYVCPEPSCVHHDPSRALGDLTGIKKHFCRKHGEKKWKCDKCYKKYAVQSDWKAHTKTCGSREYRCDCGTLFSRRDSFITHRAFCDALAEESAKARAPPPEDGSSSAAGAGPLALPPPQVPVPAAPAPLQQLPPPLAPAPAPQHEEQERSKEAPVCALVDVMYRLRAKLDGLLRHGHMLPKGAEDEIPLIKQDLGVMIAVFHDYSNSGAENCAMMIECLMKEVRELSYDIEDCIDQYEHAVDSMSGSIFRIPRRQITRRKSKTSRLPKKLKQRLWMANKIREFSMRSQEALQRYSLFTLGGISTSSTRCDASFGSFHPTPYVEHADHLVGIDAPTNKLEAWLTKDGEQKLKFVSILGSGGVGKTTLANELYRRIGWQFECRAFVRTCQKPDIRRLLISMLSQIRPNRPPGDWKVHSLIADIRTHLQDKRYLIVVDDVWATSTWDIVNCALPDGNRCSRILITTEIEDVALKCCGYDPKYVFKIKPLGEDDSRKLFFNTVVGPPESSEISNSIIRKCAGLPLATVIIASLLASRMGKPEQWDYVNKSLGYGLRMNPTFEGMKQVLNLSYNNLPQHLKPCMLYLSIYQEDYIIWKDDLVKQWIAEGFICATEGKDEEEISRSYFDELISSRMIQPVYINDTDEILSCTVHYMVLNFIKHKSIVENFVTAIDHSQTSTRLADKVRRLSLQFGNAEDATQPTNMRLSQIRTLAFFGVFNCVPSIMEFRLLQVLILQFWGDEEIISLDLTRISELFRLRYLQVTSNVTLELRTQMQGLQYLETLKIDARVSVVPSDFVRLPGLLHLNLPAETNLPDGIGHLTSLRTLGYFDLGGNSKENVQSLGELTNLQDLQLTYSKVRSGYLVGNMECLGSILRKLNNLKSLTLVSAGSSHSSTTDAAYQPTSMFFSGDGLSSMSSPPALLHKLELPHICIFSSFPKWIGGLPKLCILKIAVRELSRNDVDVLKELPALTVLSLFVRTVPSERIAFDKTGFLRLKYFKFRCTVPWLKFEANAMPNLWKLKLGFCAHENVWYGATPVGVEYLSGLKEVSAKIWCVGPEESNRMTAESVLRDTIRMHPGRPRVHIQHVDKMFDGEEDKISVTIEEHGASKQCDIMEEDTNEQHEALQKNSGEDLNKQADSWAISSPRESTSFTDSLGGLAEGGVARYKFKTPPSLPHSPQPVSPRSYDGLFDLPVALPITFSPWPTTGAFASQHQSAVQGGKSEQRPYSDFSFPTAPGNNEVGRTAISSHQYHSARRRLTDDGYDGYNWRQSWHMQAMGSKNQISYYECTFPGCPAKKKVESSLARQIIETVYMVSHNHPIPQNVDMYSDGVLQSAHEASEHPDSGISGVSEVLDED